MSEELRAIVAAIQINESDAEDSTPALSAADVRRLRDLVEQRHGRLRPYVDAVVAYEKARGMQHLVERSPVPDEATSLLEQELHDTHTTLNDSLAPESTTLLSLYRFLCEEELRLLGQERRDSPPIT